MFSTECKIITSKSFYIFLHYIFWVWICDILNMFALFMNFEQDTLFINLLAIFVVGFMIINDLKFFVFEKTDFKCCIGVAIFGVIALMYSVYPDNSHDTWTYHLLNQDPVWQGRDGFSYRENLYPLADRLFYLFRYILGFKLGTLFNWILLSLTYVQIVRILKMAANKINNTVFKIFNPYFMAFCCVSLETIMMIYATYMTDLTSAPIILETVICLLLVSEKAQVSLNEMIYFAVGLGFIFLMKLTTVIYIIPLLVIYIVLVNKSLTCKKFAGCCLIGIGIVMPYLIYNYVITGRPFYPIRIFSELTAVSDLNTGSSHDGRWGATNLVEIIFWPVFMALKPKYRHMEMVVMPNIYPLLAVCFGGGMLVKGLVKKEKNKKSTILLLTALMSLYLWIISRTVDRYGVCSIILCGVAVVVVLYTCINSRKIIAICSILFVLQAGCSYYSFMELGKNFKWPPQIETVATQSVHSLFNEHYGRTDRGSLVSDSEKYQYYVSPQKYYNSYGKFLNENSILFDLRELSGLPEDDKKIVYDELRSLQNEGNYFYTASMEGGLDGSIQDAVESLKKYGFSVVDVEFMQNTYLGNIVVYKSVLSDDISDVLVFSEKTTIQVDMEKDQTVCIRGLMFVSPRIKWTKDPTSVNFYILDNSGNKVLVSQKEIIPGTAEHINVNVDTAMSSDSKLYIKCDNKYGLDWDFAYIVNMEQEVIENSLSDRVFFEESSEIIDNPWGGLTAGIIELEGEKCILLNPNTSANISVQNGMDKLELLFKIHPFVNVNSDGAGIMVYVLDKNNAVLFQDELQINNKDDWQGYCLDVGQYNQASLVKLVCNNGLNNDSRCDWVIIK